jgi:hypothetical protein
LETTIGVPYDVKEARLSPGDQLTIEWKYTKSRLKKLRPALFTSHRFHR